MSILFLADTAIKKETTTIYVDLFHKQRKYWYIKKE